MIFMDYREELISHRDKVLVLLNSPSYSEIKEKFIQLCDVLLSGKFSDKEIYQAEADIVSLLVNKSFVNINRYYPDRKTLEIKAISGLNHIVETMMKMGNIGITGKNLSLNDKFVELSLLQGRLMMIPGGLEEAALKGFPEPLVIFIDEMFGPLLCYAGGFVFRDNLVGNLVIITRNIKIDEEKENIINHFLPAFAIIEMLCRNTDTVSEETPNNQI